MVARVKMDQAGTEEMRTAENRDPREGDGAIAPCRVMRVAAPSAAEGRNHGVQWFRVGQRLSAVRDFLGLEEFFGEKQAKMATFARRGRGTAKVTLKLLKSNT